EKRPALKIATTPRDRDNLCSYAIELVFRAHGIEPEDILKWGGEFVEHENPRACIRNAIVGDANAVFNEAIMVSQWRELVQAHDMRFLPIEPEAMSILTGEYGLRPATLAAGRLRNESDVPCLDWSNWAVF